jgi:hypothetical protein
MTERLIRGIQPISLEPSSALTGASVSAITSTITVGCGKNREQPDNSHLSPDKYELDSAEFSPRLMPPFSRNPSEYPGACIGRGLT